MKRKLFIFGGFGFIGLNLSNLLYKDFKISLIGNNKQNYFPKNCHKMKNNIYDLNIIKKINFNNSNIILPILMMKKEKIFKVKFKKLLNLLLSKNPKKIILLSSASVYGSSKNLINEKSKLKTNSNYSKFCKIAENISLEENNRKIIILRISNLFGPLRDKPSLIEKIIYNYLFKNIYKINRKKMIRSYISIWEFSKIIKKIINMKPKNKIYNISNPNYIKTSSQIINFFENKFKKKILNYSREKVIISNSIISSKLFAKDYKFKFDDNFRYDLSHLIKLYSKYDV